MQLSISTPHWIEQAKKDKGTPYQVQEVNSKHLIEIHLSLTQMPISARSQILYGPWRLS